MFIQEVFTFDKPGFLAEEAGFIMFSPAYCFKQNLNKLRRPAPNMN